MSDYYYLRFQVYDVVERVFKFLAFCQNVTNNVTTIHCVFF